MTTLNSKLRLQLLANKKPKNIIEKGFTLVELMVTVAVVGVLAAAAFPAYTGAQQKASAGALIGSMQAYAKECSTKAITDDTSVIVLPSGVSFTGTNTGDCSGGSEFQNTTAFTAANIGGLKCGATTGGVVETADGSTDTKCTLTISDAGIISGQWGS